MYIILKGEVAILIKTEDQNEIIHKDDHKRRSKLYYKLI